MKAVFDQATFPVSIMRCSLAEGERADLGVAARPSLILVEQGDVTMPFCQMDVPLPAFSSLFVNASCRRHVRTNRDSVIVLMEFSPSLFDSSMIADRYVKPLLSSRIEFIVLSHPSSACLAQAVEALEEVRFGNELRFLSRLYDVFSMIVYEKEDILKSGALQLDPRLERMLEYMKANLDRHLSVDMIARSGFVSPREASRLFARQLSTSPMRHFLTMRLEEARRLLEGDVESIWQVCEKTGFESMSHFSTAFRRMYATSPSEYRSRFI